MAGEEAPKDATSPTVAVAPRHSQISLSNSSEDEKSQTKASPPTATTAAVTTDLERAAETDGYLLDENAVREKYGLSAADVLKKSSDGKVLIPQPTDSPEDPLNWPRWKKMTILVVLVANAFTADYSAATGASALLPQAEEWHLSPDEINHATAG